MPIAVPGQRFALRRRLELYLHDRLTAAGCDKDVRILVNVCGACLGLDGSEKYLFHVLWWIERQRFRRSSLLRPEPAPSSLAHLFEIATSLPSFESVISSSSGQLDIAIHVFRYP